MHSIDDLFEQMLIESDYLRGERQKMSALFLGVIAVVLILFSMILRVGSYGSISFWILFISSLFLGVVAMALNYGGNDIIDDAVRGAKALERAHEERMKQQP